MKHRLVLKFLLAYAIFAVLAFCIIAVFGSRAYQAASVRTAAEELYREVRTIASYQSAGYSSGLSVDTAQLRSLAQFTGCRVILLSDGGEVVFDTGSPSLLGRILAFDPADSPEYHRTGSFYGAFDTDQLSVFSPITANLRLYGYVTLHQPMSVILARADAALGSAYLLIACLFILFLLMLLSLLFLVLRPLRSITDGADEYAKGNLSHRISVKTQDEFGYLASTLNIMAEELENADAYQKKFIANVSHDFRSPLTSIRGYLQAMIDGVIPAESQEKYMNIIIGETERLTNLTQSMLALNSLDGARQKLELSDFDIAAMTKGLCETFGAVCGRRHIMFDLVFSEAKIPVRADAGRIQQALYNLIDNAIKFSEDNSAIRIKIYPVGEKIAVSVKDRGIGIAKEDLGKIWTRFYKSDSSRGKDRKGTGLGLSIVKEILTAHGETIDVTSTPGSGTEFIFRLPAAGPQ